MKTKLMKWFLLLFCITMVGACEEDPEDFTGNIIGKVTDANTGNVIQGVTVTLSPGGISKTTGGDGTFEFLKLNPAQYEIQVRKKGYVTNNKTVTVITGRDTRGDIQLTPEVAKLSLSSNLLDFGKSYTSQSFNIINEGNISFNWSISGYNDVDWLEVSPTSGSLSAGKSFAVQVNVLREKLTESKEITLLVNVDKQSVALKVIAEVEKKVSKITLNTNTLNFGKDYSSLTFDIHNEGNIGNVDWRITDIDADWINVSPTTGTTAMGKSSTVKVDVDREKLSEGDQTTTILVNSEGESQRVTINATGVSKVAKITLDKTTLDFGTDLISETFNISNVGNAGDISWEITNIDVDWVKVAPLTGTTSVDKSSAVKVELDREKMPEGRQTTTILVNAYGESFPVVINAEGVSKVAKITLSSNILNFGLDYSSLTFDINNVGNAGDISWTITGIDVEWIKVFPTNGTTSMDKSSAVKVEVDREKMVEGKNATTILVEAYGESFPVTINAERKPARYIEVMPSTLTLGTNNKATLSILSHNGATAYELYGDGDYSWATFSKTEGVIPEYNSSNVSTIENITVSADRTGLAAGSYSFTLIIRSDLGDTYVPVSMTVEEQQIPGGGNAEIISSHDDLEYTLTSCTMSGTTATLEMKVKNIGTTTKRLYLSGGHSYSYAYDDQGNKYENDNLKLAFSNGSLTPYNCNTDIPAGIMTKMTIKIYNIHDEAAALNNIRIGTNFGNANGELMLKNVTLEGRTAIALSTQQTTGTVVTCDDDLEFTLIDCKAGSNHTTISFRVKNIGRTTEKLYLNGGHSYSYAYDNEGNKYEYDNLKVAFANYSLTPYSCNTDIPSGVMVKCTIQISNVDSNATEFSNITIRTNYKNRTGELVFKNVKIRK